MCPGSLPSLHISTYPALAHTVSKCPRIKLDEAGLGENLPVRKDQYEDGYQHRQTPKDEDATSSYGSHLPSSAIDTRLLKRSVLMIFATDEPF